MASRQLQQFSVRPFDKERDYDAKARIHNATFPDRPATAQEFRAWDEASNKDPKFMDEEYVVEIDSDTGEADRIVAALWFGHWPGMYHPQKFYFDLVVHPDYRRQGIGGMLYERALEGIAPYEPIQLTNVAFENQPEGLAFLKRRGFEERMRFWESALNVDTFDPAPYDHVREKVKAAGIEISNEAELAGDPDYERNLYQLHLDLVEDVPLPDQHTPEPFERFLETRRKSINRIPEAYFIAVDTATGRFAGTSSLWKSHAASYLRTGLTGVRREYRRKGIALALKLQAIDYARSVGAPLIKTDNESNNRPMLSINEMLGFERGTVEIDMCKKFMVGPEDG